MTSYKSFSMCNPINIVDSGSMREFHIVIPQNKYITISDIMFNIKYNNVDYNKLDEIRKDFNKNKDALHLDVQLGNIGDYKEKMNNLIDKMSNEYCVEMESSKSKWTQLSMFQSIELYVIDKTTGENKCVAKRILSSVDEIITDDKLYLHNVFKGAKFKYSSKYDLLIKFYRSAKSNKCLKFECVYNLHDEKNDEKYPDFNQCIYKEYIIPILNSGYNVDIEEDYKEIIEEFCITNNVEEPLKRLAEIYNTVKLTLYKDGMKTEAFNGKGLYHIDFENLVEDGMKNNICLKLMCVN